MCREVEMRIDFQSLTVTTAAVAAALGAAWCRARIDESAHAADARTPVLASVTTPGVAQVTRHDDGHYWAEAEVNGEAVRMLVDTGATVVALTRDDALRLGFRLTEKDFTREVMTANGPGRAAPVELSHVAVAGARIEKVEALVVERGLPASLLGMSFLGRLSKLEATPNGLTLRS